MLLVQFLPNKNIKSSSVVSIHYMLLVQLIYIHFEMNIVIRFNTLYVVGSKSIITDLSNSSVFQYIICCWFNVSHHHQKEYVFGFNTLYVVGSILKLVLI